MQSKTKLTALVVLTLITTLEWGYIVGTGAHLHLETALLLRPAQPPFPSRRNLAQGQPEIGVSDIARGPTHKARNFKADDALREKSQPSAKWVTENSRWIKDASDDTIDAVKFYKHRGFRKLNRALRDGTKLDPLQKELVKELDSALDAGGIQKEVNVYRGVRLDSPQQRDELLSNFQAAVDTGDTVQFKGYTSTSFNPEISSGFTGEVDSSILFEIRAKSGVYVDEVVIEEEFELLQAQNTRYRPTRILRGVEYQNWDKGRRKYTVVQMEEVVDEVKAVADEVAAGVVEEVAEVTKLAPGNGPM
jgi:hypothetical protein